MTLPARNDLFTGRAELVQRISAEFEKSRAVVISGPDGIGKTQVALEYAHACAVDRPVAWINFSSPDNVPIRVSAEGAAAASELRPDYQELSLDDQLHAVLRVWQADEDRLLVFDDCQDEDLLREWVPAAGQARILVTSRLETWDGGTRPSVIQVDPLSRGESVALVRKLRPDLATDQRDLHDIADELEDHPMGLRIAGGLMIWGADAGVGALLQQLRGRALMDHAAALAAEDQPPAASGLLGRWRSAKPPPVARTFALTVRWLEHAEVGRAALSVLARMACFAAAELLPSRLLRDSVEEGADDGLAWLIQLGLLEMEDGMVRMHPVVADMVRASLPHSGPELAAEECILDWAEEIGESDDAGLRATVISHLDYMAGLTHAHGHDERTASLSFELGRQLFTAGDLRRARANLERALEIRERRLGLADQRTLKTLVSLGSILAAQRDLDGAREKLQLALDVAESTLGPHHAETADILSSLAGTLRQRGDLVGARTLLERAMDISQQILAPGDAQLVARQEGLALLLHEYGDPAGAQAYATLALEALQQQLGPEHPRSLAAINNMGMLLRDQGNGAAAKTYFEYALRVSEERLGDNHPETAAALDNLGTLLHADGDLNGAKELFERALAIREHTLGSDSPASGISYNHLGMLLREQGDLEGARPYLEQALVVSQRTLGPYDPQTAASYNNLGVLLLDLDDAYNAQPALERALAIREQGLGADHPETAASLANVAAVHVAFGDIAGARTYLERSLEIREEVLGPEHQQTATSLYELGVVLRDLGEAEQAMTLLSRSAGIREHVLGPDHPDTLASLNALDRLTRESGRRTSAWPRAPLPDSPFFEQDRAP